MKKLSGCIVLISLAVFFIFSCKKDKTSLTSVDESSSGSSVRTTVTGIVLDESNAPLNGVTVIAHGQTATTNQYGTFVLKNISVNKDRCVLQFAKAGFFKRLHGFIAAENTVNYVRIVLTSNASSQSFSSSAGGTFSLADGSSVLFQPSSFVKSNGSAYNGTVNIAIKHLSPGDANFGFMIPGGDLLGKDLDDKDVALYSYGMLGVELTGSSGEALQLATGTPATLTFSITASQTATSPASIPLWYFDETTSLWKEEGSATKVNNAYIGTVKHFSWWNCDYQGPKAYITGRVVDCFGVPLPNINVTVDGWCIMTTDQNGEFYDAFPCGMTFTIQVLTSNNGGLVTNSQVVTVPALSPNQVYTIPDLVVPCITRVAGYIKSCSGEASEGFVSVSNTSFYNFQYTSNGSFNLPVVENIQAILYAINSSNFYKSQNITTLAAPNNLNVGNLLLCDSTSGSNNSFTLNGGPFSNQLFNISITNSSAQLTDTFGTAETRIQIVGNSLPYTISTYHININDTILGPSTGEIYLSFSAATDNYLITGYSIPSNLNIIGIVGNKIKGTYNGAVLIYVNGGSAISGNISGSFDVIRTQ